MLNGLAAQQMDFAIWQYLAPPPICLPDISKVALPSVSHLISLFGVVLQRAL